MNHKIGMSDTADRKQLRRDCLFLAGIIAAFFFLLWKSKYGTGAYDEPFYLTIPHRISMGDGMFSEEWNFGQFSAFLMLPVMKLYLLVKGTTEGIVLHFRYLYIVFQTVCTAVIYVNLRKRELGWAAAWMFFIFCPYDIMAISYNTMGLAFMTITGTLLAVPEKQGAKAWYFSGVLFAAAVLCNPFLAVLYFLYTLLAAVIWLIKKRSSAKFPEEKRPEMGNLGFQAWGWITAGAGTLAVLFAVTVLSGSTVQELMTNIPLLMQDPEHTGRSVFLVVQVYLSSFWNIYGWYIPVWAVLLFMAYLFRKDGRKRKLSFGLMSLSCVLCLIGFLPDIQNSYNFIMVPMAVCGAAAYIMTEYKDGKTFWYLYIFGFAYSFMANYASNQGMYAISMAMLPADAASVLFIGKFVQQERETEEEQGRKILTAAVVFLFTAQIGTQVYAKAVHAFWEEPVWRLQAVIGEGPLKGTVTTDEKAVRYTRMLEDIKTHIKKEGPVLFITEDTWCYLYADTQYGTFSSYLSGGLEQAAQKWKLYFEAHPDKIPYYIYFPAGQADGGWGITAERVSEDYGYDMERSEESYHLYRNK